MSKAPAVITADEWEQALQLENAGGELPSKDWKTIKQIRAKPGWKWKISRTRELISRMVEKGAAECRTFNIHTPNGRSFPVPHYKLKK